MAKKTVLIVDDDPDFQEAVSVLLEAKGYGVLTAGSGEEGLAAAKSGKPDLILLDVMMTHQTEGFDVARGLRDEPSTRDIPVIIVTGIRKETDVAYGFQPDKDWLPVKAVLEKPVKPEDLLKTIEANVA